GELLLNQKLTLPGHQVLLLLLAALKRILLVGGQGGAKARKAISKRWLDSAGSRLRRICPPMSRTPARSALRQRRNALQGNKEGLALVPYTLDELAQRLKFGIFYALDIKIGRKVTPLEPVVHFQPGKRAL